MKDLTPLKPTRDVSTKSDPTETQAEQEGSDIEHEVLIREHHKRVLQLEEC